MKGLLIAAVLFPIAGCVAGRRSLPEVFLFGVGIVGAVMFVAGYVSGPSAATDATRRSALANVDGIAITAT